MRNPLQEQLLKAGLVKKSKAAEIVREQNKARHAKSPATPAADQVDARRLQAERAERDRALAAERNAQAKIAEQRAQVRQIVDAHKLPRDGEIGYAFVDGDKVRRILVNEALRAQLAKGVLVVVRHGDGYELLPRAAAEKVRARDAEAIVVDHSQAAVSAGTDADDEYYSRFKVPDDLIW